MQTRTLQKDALSHCAEALARFAQTAAAAPLDAWTLRETPDGWSIGDIVEHVTIATRNIAARLDQMAARPLNGQTSSVADVEIPYLFYRGEEPPSVATPTGAFHADRTAALTGFDYAARAVLVAVEASTLDLRGYGVKHPVFGVLDGVQWILFAGAHTERHRAQMIGQLGRGPIGATI